MVIWKEIKSEYTIEQLLKRYPTIARIIINHSVGISNLMCYEKIKLPPTYIILPKGARVYFESVRCAFYLDQINESSSFFQPNRLLVQLILLGVLHGMVPLDVYEESKSFIYKYFGIPVGACTNLVLQTMRQTGKSTTIGHAIYVGALFQCTIKAEYFLITSGTHTTARTVLAAAKDCANAFEVYRTTYSRIFTRMFTDPKIGMRKRTKRNLVSDNINQLVIRSFNGNMKNIVVCAPTIDSLRSKNYCGFWLDEGILAESKVYEVTKPYAQQQRSSGMSSTPSPVHTATPEYDTLLQSARASSANKKNDCFLIERTLACECCLASETPEMCPHKDYLRLAHVMDRTLLQKKYHELVGTHGKPTALCEYFGITSVNATMCFNEPELRNFDTRINFNRLKIDALMQSCIFLSVDPPSHVTSYFSATAFICYYKAGQLKVTVVGMLERKLSDNKNAVLLDELKPVLFGFLNKIYKHSNGIHRERQLAPIIEIQNNTPVANGICQILAEHTNNRKKGSTLVRVCAALTANKMCRGVTDNGTSTTAPFKITWIQTLLNLIIQDNLAFYKECTCDINGNDNLGAGIAYLKSQLTAYTMLEGKLKFNAISTTRDDLSMSVLFGIGRATEFITLP